MSPTWVLVRGRCRGRVLWAGLGEPSPPGLSPGTALLAQPREESARRNPSDMTDTDDRACRWDPRTASQLGHYRDGKRDMDEGDAEEMSVWRVQDVPNDLCTTEGGEVLNPYIMYKQRAPSMSRTWVCGQLGCRPNLI